jgi:hypothetical protein
MITSKQPENIRQFKTFDELRAEVFASLKLHKTHKNGLETEFNCPYCFDDHHLYVNVSNAFYCHKCGQKGNILTLAKHIGIDTFKTVKNEPKTDETVQNAVWHTYIFNNPQGVAAHGEYRIEKGLKKDIRQFQFGLHGERINNMDGCQTYPYEVDKFAKAFHILVVEGLKKANLLNELLPSGYLATTNAGGAGKWKPEYNQYFLDDQTVYILPDLDEAGKKHAITVYDQLTAAKKRVCLVNMPEIPVLKNKYKFMDVSDLIESGQWTIQNLVDILEETAKQPENKPAWWTVFDEPMLDGQSDTNESVIADMDSLAVREMCFDYLCDNFLYNPVYDMYLERGTWQETGANNIKNILSYKLLDYGKKKPNNEVLRGFLIDSSNGLHYSYFTVQHGLKWLNSGNSERLLTVDGQSLFVSSDFKPVPIPEYTGFNRSIWQPIAALFEEPDLFYSTISRFFRNIIRTINSDRTDIMPIFPIITGRQGQGKDHTIIRFLTNWIPAFYRSSNTRAEKITDSREFQSLQNCILLEFPEMQGFDRQDMQKIKSIVDTDRDISFRVLGTHKEVKFKNYLNFIGSSNRTLNDIIFDSEYRRFVELKMLDSVTWQQAKSEIAKISGGIDSLLATVNLEETDIESNIIFETQSSYKNQSPVEVFFDSLCTEESLVDRWKYKTIQDHLLSEHEYLYVGQLYDKYKVFCVNFGFKPMNISNFGKSMKPILEYNGYKYDMSNRRYKDVFELAMRKFGQEMLEKLKGVK